MVVELKNRLSIDERLSNNNLENDIIRKKRKIKEILYSDPSLITAIHNSQLEEVHAEPYDYLDVNIFSYLKITGIQDLTKNFICFEIEDRSVNRNNPALKNQFLIVLCMVNENDMTTSYNMDRHDLLSFLISDTLNCSNILGHQLVLTSDTCDTLSVSEMKFYCRTLVFQMTTSNTMLNGGNGKYDIL